MEPSSPPSPPAGASPLAPPSTVSGLHVTAIEDRQLFLAAIPPPGLNAEDAATSCYLQIAEALRDADMTIVHERIFGSHVCGPDVLAARREALLSAGIHEPLPPNFLQGHPPAGEGLAGVIVHAVASDGGDDGEAPWTILDHEFPCGRSWKQGGTTFLTLQGLGLEVPKGESRPDQTRRMIESAERALRAGGADYSHVVRTWFYLHDILDWYDDFNVARSAKYDEFGIMPGGESGPLLLPASTGIAMVPASGSAGILDLVAAIGPDGKPIAVKQLCNPGQKDAFRYGSAFSRGAVIETPEARILQLSGTAAIDDEGLSLHPGDARAQIETTLDKIETLLSSQEAELADICAATAFVKHAEDAALFWEILAKRGLEPFPAVCVVADVCRDDLLFEMDGELVY